MSEKKKHTEDILSEVFDQMAAEPDPVEEAPVELAATEEIEDGTEVEVSAEAGEKDTEQNDTEEVKAEATEEVTAEDEPDYDEPAPERWSAEMKETYAELPPKAKKMMVENVFKPMQRQYTETTTALSQANEKVKPLLEIMEQYGSDFEQAGANPVDAIKRQAAWANHFLKVGVEQGVLDMQQSFGIEPNQSGQAQETYLTPAERQIKAEVAGLKQTIQAQQSDAEKRKWDQAQQARYQAIHGELAEFINEQKDGKPAHPYVEKVAPQIAELMKSNLVIRTDEYGQPIPLKAQFAQAYTMACNMNPSIRSASVNSIKQRQVEKAKAAQDVSVVTTMPSGNPSRVSQVTISDAVENAYAQLSGRSS